MTVSAPQLTAAAAATTAVAAPSDEAHFRESAVLPTLDQQRRSPHVDGTDADQEKQSGKDDSSSSAHSTDEDHQRPNEEAQAGVQAAEAITLTWSKPWLIAAYVS